MKTQQSIIKLSDKINTPISTCSQINEQELEINQNNMQIFQEYLINEQLEIISEIQRLKQKIKRNTMQSYEKQLLVQSQKYEEMKKLMKIMDSQCKILQKNKNKKEELMKQIQRCEYQDRNIKEQLCMFETNNQNNKIMNKKMSSSLQQQKKKADKFMKNNQKALAVHRKNNKYLSDKLLNIQIEINQLTMLNRPSSSFRAKKTSRNYYDQLKTDMSNSTLSSKLNSLNKNNKVVQKIPLDIDNTQDQTFNSSEKQNENYQKQEQKQDYKYFDKYQVMSIEDKENAMIQIDQFNIS